MEEISALTLGDISAALERNFDFSAAAVATVGKLERPIEL